MPRRYQRGAIPSRRNVLARTAPHRPEPSFAVPSIFLLWPQKLSIWGNDRYGNCVTAEEAFKDACNPGVFIPDTEVLQWARQHHVLNGAELPQVMTAMERKGLVVSGSTYDDGLFSAVDWEDYGTLCAAIASTSSPVKIAVDADLLEAMIATADGSIANGWVVFGYPQSSNYDHCTSLCGFGNGGDLVNSFAAKGVGVTLPSGFDPETPSFAMFTWGTIGLIDHESVIAMTGEAWVRNPATVPK